MIGKYRSPAHSKCNIIVTQDQSKFIPCVIYIFSNYDCHLFLKKLVDKKQDRVKFEIMPKTNEECISVRYRCFRFIDSYRFLSSSLGNLVKPLVDNSHKEEKEIVDNDDILSIVKDIKNKKEVR